MKAFLAALVAVVAIAVGVHFFFGRLAPGWNAAAVAASPDAVRLDPLVEPRVEGTLPLARPPALAESERALAERIEACARLRARAVFDPSRYAGQGAESWTCPEAIGTSGATGH
ncbi:hypothetical protein HRbin40_00555 [bacterium HR40]|nr:hypothetical protein HRbin40_00555 [bacterium HR40]